MNRLSKFDEALPLAWRALAVAKEIGDARQLVDERKQATRSDLDKWLAAARIDRTEAEKNDLLLAWLTAADAHYPARAAKLAALEQQRSETEKLKTLLGKVEPQIAAALEAAAGAKAAKPDCRTAYAGMGLLAVVPLVASSVGNGGCRW